MPASRILPEPACLRDVGRAGPRGSIEGDRPMTRNPVGLTFALGLALASASSDPVPARAAPPQLKETSPLGVQKGVEAEVTIGGGNLKGTPRLIAPFRFVTVPAAGPNADAAAWKLK